MKLKMALFALLIMGSIGTATAEDIFSNADIKGMLRGLKELAKDMPAPAEVPVGSPVGRDMYRTIETLSSKAMDGRAPMSKGSRLAREYIIAQMQAYGLEPGGEESSFVQAVHKKVFGYKIGNNIIGYIRGRVNPDECVYVDAHYDHWGRAGGQLQPGANDNASGIALLLETARRLSQNRPDRTVVFLAADNEEGALIPMFGGLKGADYQASYPFCAQDHIKGALVLDTVGGAFVPGMQSQLLLIGSESSLGTYDLARGLATVSDASMPIRQLGVYAIEPLGKLAPRADYSAYRRIGVPFIFATSGLPSEYHTGSDTIEKINFDFMEKASVAVVELVGRMASAGFEGGVAQGGGVINWDSEATTAEQIIGDVLEHREQLADKASYLKTLTAQRDHLRWLLSWAHQGALPWEIKIEIKKTVSDIVVTIMKMNGSLKVWEHIFRTYGVPNEEQPS